MSEILPKGRIIECSFEFVLPAAGTPEEVADWVAFELNQSGSISSSHPLLSENLDALDEPELRDTGMNYREERTPLPASPDDPPGTTRFRVRRIRERAA